MPPKGQAGCNSSGPPGGLKLHEKRGHLLFRNDNYSPLKTVVRGIAVCAKNKRSGRMMSSSPSDDERVRVFTVCVCMCCDKCGRVGPTFHVVFERSNSKPRVGERIRDVYGN